MDYQDFLSRKNFFDPCTGHEPGALNEILFDFQRDIVRWALRRGRSAIFADCGLGKTLMQLEWANQVHKHTGGKILILAPLAVAPQTKKEGVKADIFVNIAATQDDITDGINITNYEKLHNFDCSSFSGVVLDESSIIKHHTSKTRDQLLQSFAKTPYRLACTATPAPNDYMELGNHAEFLGIMTRAEMLSMFFIHDGGDTAKWRLKGHAQSEFWKCLCSWAVMVRRPSDLGYSNKDYQLPPIEYYSHVLKSNRPLNGNLFMVAANTLQERREARRISLDGRVELAAKLVNESSEQWIVWCDLNSESEALRKAIYGSVEVKGSDPNQHKEDSMIGFSEGKYRVLVSKPSIAGFGMNFQGCRNMAFVGLSDSFEAYYQATRRCWRFGQKNTVNVHIITSELEGNVVANIIRKEKDADLMAESMIEHMSDISSSEIKGVFRTVTKYEPKQKIQIPQFMRAA